jgi:hypothetical protein
MQYIKTSLSQFLTSSHILGLDRKNEKLNLYPFINNIAFLPRKRLEN